MAVTVTGLDPASGPEGTLVVITGTDFTEDTSRVRFGSYEVGFEYTVISDTQISCIVPAGTGAQYVLVTTPAGGTNANGAQFTYATYEGGSNSVPTVTSVAPNTSAYYDGRGTDSVVITGTGYATARTVWFGATLATAAQATFTIDSPTQITAVAPPGEAGVQAYVWVENNYGTSTGSTTANDFMYPVSAVPTLTSVVPANGFPGDEIVLTGTNFIDATYVQWGTLYAEFRIDSATSITATVPGGMSLLGTSVNVYVSNPWGISADTRSFTYGSLAARNLKTTATLSTGSLAKTNNDSWIVTAAAITCTLSATYSGMPANSVDSTWYRLDNGADVKYSSAFQVHAISTEGSHKLEYWSVGKDGYVEPTNVGYINVVAVTTVAGLAAAPGTGIIIYRWTPVKIPGVRYEVNCSTAADPVLAATVQEASFTMKTAAPTTGYYCKVRAVAPDGTAYSFSGIIGPHTSLQTAADLADNAITNAKLATTMQVPEILGTLPTLPNANYPEGAIVYLTTDNKLYVTQNGTTWVKMVNTGDLDGTILWSQLASDAQTPITTAQSTADGKNKVIYSTSDASGTTGYVTGDIWFKVSSGNIIAQWQFYTGSWHVQQLTNTVIATLDAGKITTGSLSADRISTGSLDTNKLTASWLTAGAISAGAIGANEIAADSVFAKHITVADYENLVQNSNCEADPTGMDTAYNSADIEFRGVDSTFAYAGSRSRRRIASGTGTKNTLVLCDPVPCKVGDTFSLTAKARMSTQETSYGCRVEIYGLKASGAEVTLIAENTSGYHGLITWGDLSAKFTVVSAAQADTVVAVAARLCVNATANYYGYFDQILFRKNLSGSLIVDGEITGTTFTGGTFRTYGSGQRVEMVEGDKDRVKFYTGHASEVTDGYAYAQGNPSGHFWLVGPKLGSTGTGNLYLGGATTDAGVYASLVAPYDGQVSLVGGETQLQRPGLARSGYCISHEYTAPLAAYAAGVQLGEFVSDDIGNGVAASGGTSMNDSASIQHPGTVKYYSASSATNSGRAMRTAIDSIYLGQTDTMEFVVNFPSAASTVRGRYGLMASFGTTSSTGVFISVAGNGSNIIATGYNDATATAGTCTLSTSTWYRLRIVGGSSRVDFYVYNTSGEVSWSNTKYISAKSTTAGGFGFASFNTSAASVYTLEIDYMGMSLAGNRRGL